jgi:hypothetical protein
MATPKKKPAKKVSVCQVQRTLEITYKTAWFLCHRIRAAMREVSADRLKGIVDKLPYAQLTKAA